MGLRERIRVSLNERGGRNMKYTLTTTRTYETTYNVVADSESDAWDWISENGDLITEAELEQCNVIDEETTLEPCTPSPNEVDELMALAYQIQGKLREYRHVEDFIPKSMHDALHEMLTHNWD